MKLLFASLLITGSMAYATPPGDVGSAIDLTTEFNQRVQNAQNYYAQQEQAQQQKAAAAQAEADAEAKANPPPVLSTDDPYDAFIFKALAKVHVRPKDIVEEKKVDDSSIMGIDGAAISQNTYLIKTDSGIICKSVLTYDYVEGTTYRRGAGPNDSPSGGYMEIGADVDCLAKDPSITIPHATAEGKVKDNF